MLFHDKCVAVLLLDTHNLFVGAFLDLRDLCQPFVEETLCITDDLPEGVIVERSQLVGY